MSKRIICVGWMILQAMLSQQLLAVPVPVMQAKPYSPGIAVSEYFVSEKLDGVRARWTGKRLVSRNGYTFAAPAQFTQGFPAETLDGELWMGRGEFQRVMSVVRTQGFSDSHTWEGVRFMVFDLPESNKTFAQRLMQMKAIIEATDSDSIALLKQYRVLNEEALQQELKRVVGLGGEGLMLHHQASRYRRGRSDMLLKVKTYDDAEAEIVGYVGGKGKYLGMLGSLKMRTSDGRYFKLGSGMTDRQRANPPKIGSVVTYKYFGLTRAGLPRFASFLRVRKEPMERVESH